MKWGGRKKSSKPACRRWSTIALPSNLYIKKRTNLRHSWYSWKGYDKKGYTISLFCHKRYSTSNRYKSRACSFLQNTNIVHTNKLSDSANHTQLGQGHLNKFTNIKKCHSTLLKNQSARYNRDRAGQDNKGTFFDCPKRSICGITTFVRSGGTW